MGQREWRRERPVVIVVRGFIRSSSSREFGNRLAHALVLELDQFLVRLEMPHRGHQVRHFDHGGRVRGFEEALPHVRARGVAGLELWVQRAEDAAASVPA